jgi:hypothetical protein
MSRHRKPERYRFDDAGFSGMGLRERMAAAYDLAEHLDAKVLAAPMEPTARAWLSGVSAAMRAVSKP